MDPDTTMRPLKTICGSASFLFIKTSETPTKIRVRNGCSGSESVGYDNILKLTTVVVRALAFVEH
jgi:hypothetical protein